VFGGNTRIKSNYNSVVERTGLYAGDEGFQVVVKGDTTLTGAVIASSERAVQENKNSFASGSLALTDINNGASYSGTAFNVQLGRGIVDGGVDPQGTSAGLGKVEGDASSVTRAGISGVAGHQEVRTGDTETGIAPIFDAKSVEKNLAAQVSITQNFNALAPKFVGDFADQQAQKLRAQGDNAEAAKWAEGGAYRIAMNVLVGALGGEMTGASIAASKEVLGWASGKMREAMIAQSRIFAGVTDGKTVLSNASGTSGYHDGFKLGGTRVVLDIVCGKNYERCAKQRDQNGAIIKDKRGIPLLELNENGMVEFKNIGNSLAEFLASPEGLSMGGLTGGVQELPGTLAGYSYAPGSVQDMIIESFAGPHDMIGGQLSGLYDSQGNALQNRTKLVINLQETWSIVAIPIAAPFAMADYIKPEVWQALSVILTHTR
jgi:filamentous hemagglutinin